MGADGGSWPCGVTRPWPRSWSSIGTASRGLELSPWRRRWRPGAGGCRCPSEVDDELHPHEGLSIETGPDGVPGPASWGAPAAAGARPARPPVLPDPLQGGSEDPPPAQTNQPLPPAGALARAHGPDLGQGEVAAVGLDPNHPGAEGAAVRGSALALEPRQADGVPTKPASWGAPDPATVELARPRPLPAPGGPRPRYPLAKASLEGTLRSRLGGDPLAIWGHHPSPVS